MNVLVRLVFLSAAAIALTPPGASDGQTLKPGPRGGSILSGPYSTAARGPNGEVISGPSGAAVRGPNSGSGARSPYATAARVPTGAVAVGHPTRYGAAAVRPAYGASTGRTFSYGGHRFHGVYAPTFVYPQGWPYRRWAVGAVLPAVLLTSPYSYTGYAAMGLPSPAAGHQWVRYGPDLLLADTRTGAVIHSAYGVFQQG